MRKKIRLSAILKGTATAAIMFIIAFLLGVFPAKPVVIATGSMEPSLYPGDVAIISSIATESIEVGDVIGFKQHGFTVVHRVAEIGRNDSGEIYFITAGDNNNASDQEPVEVSDIVGKVYLTVPKLGCLSLWINGMN